MAPHPPPMDAFIKKPLNAACRHTAYFKNVVSLWHAKVTAILAMSPINVSPRVRSLKTLYRRPRAGTVSTKANLPDPRIFFRELTIEKTVKAPGNMMDEFFPDKPDRERLHDRVSDPIPVIYPKYPYKIKEEAGKHFILDEVRKKWLVLTPEEWVRQNFIRYMIEVKKCPASYIVIERKIVTGQRTSRFDIVIYGPDAKPWMLVECKNMNIEPGDKEIYQVLRYHAAAPSQFLVVTNGLFVWCYEKVNGWFKAAGYIPTYPE
jgi:hypothetical protein